MIGSRELLAHPAEFEHATSNGGEDSGMSVLVSSGISSGGASVIVGLSDACWLLVMCLYAIY